MKWKFWEKVDLTVLPQFVRQIVESQSRLDQETIDRLAYALKPVNRSGRKVNFIRIYDPRLISCADPQTTTYDDLDSHRNAVLFEGQYDRGSSRAVDVSLTRLRSETPMQYASGESPAGRMSTETDRQDTIGTKDKPIEILLVVDNPGDVSLTQEAVENSDIHSNVNVAEDGEKALAFLRREGEYANSPRPDMVLLDLALPGNIGHEVLAQIKTVPELRRIPVVVLSASQAEEDLHRSSKLQANSYIIKPLTVASFNSAVRMAKDYWIAMSRLGSPDR